MRIFYKEMHNYDELKLFFFLLKLIYSKIALVGIAQPSIAMQTNNNHNILSGAQRTELTITCLCNKSSLTENAYFMHNH